MKTILHFIAGIFFLTISAHLNAQDATLQFTVTNASAAGACDGAMEVQCIGCLAPVTYEWYDTTGTLIGTGNYVSGLCPSTNYCYAVYVNDQTCPGHFLYATMKVASVSGPSFQLNTSLLYYSSSSYNYFHIDSVRGGTGPYSYWLYDDMDASPDVSSDYIIDSSLTVPAITNVVFDSLYDPFFSSSDFYSLHVIDFSGNFIGYYFTTLLDTSITCNIGPGPLWAVAQGFPVSDSALCDASAYATAYGGTAPYTYSFSSGALDSTETGLCPGAYIVTVTDAMAATFNTTFVIGYPGTMYYSDPGALTYIDTLYANATEECGLDFSIPLDSFYIDTAYAISAWAYQANWIVIQDTNSYSFQETYYLDSTGNYMFGLSLYCSSRSSSFGSYSLFAGMHADQELVTGTQSPEHDPFLNLYPNPSRGIYHLSSPSKIKSYSVTDQLGKRLIQHNSGSMEEIINLETLKNGIYFLTVRFENGKVSRRKIVKD
jgi:hypothetical protein